MRLDSACERLRQSPRFKRWVAPIVRNVRDGSWKAPAGYVTESKGEPRARVRTRAFERCVPIDTSLGDGFNDAHYWHILFEAYVRRMVDGIGEAVLEAGFGSGWDKAWTHERRWWMPAVVAEIEEAVGTTARWRCQQAYEAAMEALADPEDSRRRADLDRRRNRSHLQRYARYLLDQGCTLEQIHGWVDEALVGQVMDEG